MNSLIKLIDEKIQRREKKIIGTAVSFPVLITLGGQKTWTADVLIGHDKELMRKVPISENNRQIRNFVTEGTPVEIEKSPGGQFYISGLANKQKGFVNFKTYSLASAGLAFSQGYRKNSGGNFESGNGNEFDLTGVSEQTRSYVFEIIPYGELNYGVDIYGAKRAIRT